MSAETWARIRQLQVRQTVGGDEWTPEGEAELAALRRALPPQEPWERRAIPGADSWPGIGIHDDGTRLHLRGARLRLAVAEEIAEDHGFYAPVFERVRGGITVTEGFGGHLCSHAWGFAGHYGRNPFGQFWTCERCGVVAATSTRKNSRVTAFQYGEWELREHVWSAWRQCGPVPGSLEVQAWHSE